MEDFKLDIEAKLQHKREGSLLLQDKSLAYEFETMLSGSLNTQRTGTVKGNWLILDCSCSSFLHWSEEGSVHGLHFHFSIMENYS